MNAAYYWNPDERFFEAPVPQLRELGYRKAFPKIMSEYEPSGRCDVVDHSTDNDSASPD